VIYSVLTPPPGFDALRRLQADLERAGRPWALALPPIMVLGEGETAPRLIEVEPVWTRGRNGWKLGGEAYSGPFPSTARLSPETGWLLLPWDAGPPPELEVPLPLPRRKLTWGLLEILPEPGGLKWRWIKQKAFLGGA